MRCGRKGITAADRERFASLRQLGCIACTKRGIVGSKAEIHHLVEGYRLGHEYTIPLCTWHHRGERTDLSVSMESMRGIFGPSMAREKRQFVGEFGSERELLEEVDKWLKEGSPPGTKGQQQSESSLPF